ncbi:unnamed protein product [Psylliodes chrysocephalus]|uniref:Uncharacterized protein n=1 Tax=Psylliodes chrysocephalus TaxID=3402493 RepID=A0A9P0G6F8_9CUCU|nr:unnamed protein product [Psylliodes chrysocephala]
MKFFITFMCCIVSVAVARKLPSFIEVCHPKRVDVGECVKKNLEILRPKFRQGIPELQIPAFNPLKLSSADIKLGENFKTNLKNIKLWFSNSFSIEEFKVDLDHFRLEFTIKFPEVKAQGDYSINGKLLILNLDGAGLGKIFLHNLTATVVASGKKEKKNGKEYIVPTNVDIKPEVQSMNIHLENLFPSNPELTEQANKLFNDNQKVLFEDFSPLIVNLVKKLISNYINNFFSRYSYDVLFPDD